MFSLLIPLVIIWTLAHVYGGCTASLKRLERLPGPDRWKVQACAFAFITSSQKEAKASHDVWLRAMDVVGAHSCEPIVCEGQDDYYYRPSNVTRSTLSGIQAYRSALTLDWLAAEDMRQRELAAAFETEVPSPTRIISTDCIGYSRPASGKIARLMLELLKNLEGDESPVITDMIGALVRAKLLVETSMLDAEPDLDALVKTPGVMMGEPHTTFPRVLAMAWMTVSDPVTTKKFGWCPLQKVNKYLAVQRPVDIAKHMKALEPIIARGRFIMEEFIQHVTPLNMYEKKNTPPHTTTEKVYGIKKKISTYPPRTPNVRTAAILLAQSATTRKPATYFPISTGSDKQVQPNVTFQEIILTEAPDRAKIRHSRTRARTDQLRIQEQVPDIVENDRIVLLTSYSAPIFYLNQLLLLSIVFVVY